MRVAEANVLLAAEIAEALAVLEMGWLIDDRKLNTLAVEITEVLITLMAKRLRPLWL